MTWKKYRQILVPGNEWKLLFPGCNSDSRLLLRCYFSKITHLLYDNNFCCCKAIFLVFCSVKLEMYAEREKGR